MYPKAVFWTLYSLLCFLLITRTCYRNNILDDEQCYKTQIHITRHNSKIRTKSIRILKNASKIYARVKVSPPYTNICDPVHLKQNIVAESNFDLNFWISTLIARTQGCHPLTRPSELIQIQEQTDLFSTNDANLLGPTRALALLRIR